jgi:uncharacterized membrane protein YvlD (DUF360 family)
MELGSPAVMPGRDHFFAVELAHVFKNAGVRTGIYSGVALAIGFSTWLYVANRVPSLEVVALQRNFISAVVLGLFAVIPVLRFLRSPGELLVSSLVAWSILTIAYSGLCLHFHALADRFSAPQIFTLGAVVYMIVATLSWIGTCIWRARASHISHPHHHV